MPLLVDTTSEPPPGWGTFARVHPSATFSHQATWLQIVRDVYGGKPYYLTAFDGDEIVGILPLMARWAIGRGRALISAPFADVAGVCASNQEATDALLAAAEGLGRRLRVRCVELRQLSPGPRDLPCDQSRVTMIRALPDDSDALWEDLKAKVRNQVRKAQRSDLVCTDGGHQLLGAFYRVYARNTRDLGSPMHSARFFGEITRTMGDRVKVLLVQRGQDVLAGGIAVWHGSTLSVPWAGSLREHRPLCPNNLLYWEALKLAVELGCNRFDFGRSIPDSGTYRFKRQWRSEEHQLHYQFIPVTGSAPVGERREGWPFRFFSRVWPHTPMWLAERVGPQLLARLPI